MDSFYFAKIAARTPQNEVLSEFEWERTEGEGSKFIFAYKYYFLLRD